MPRRQLLQQFGMGFGGIALADLLSQSASAVEPTARSFEPKAKRVIYLFQSGGPSQMDLFDNKPVLKQMEGQELPEEVRKGQRLTAMSGLQASLPLAGTPFKFEQHGESGAWLSEKLPHTAAIADDLCFVKSMHTPAINHGPAVTFMQTGSQFPGRPSMGAWLDYGLGTENSNLPSFVVMVTKGKGGQPLVSRLWGSGFLPSRHQGVRFRAGSEPVLYVNNPAGLDRDSKARMLEALRRLHESRPQQDAVLETEIAQHELAFRMQASIPDVNDVSSEPDHIFDLYGKEARTPGTFAANCLLARRLCERGVRFVQLYHPGWDQHGGLPGGISNQCRETDQASAALVSDLKQRGLLEDTLVIWGGEFGRTNYCQGGFSKNFGRDHHPRCFTMWMAGGGIRPGTSYGATDDWCYNIAENPVSVHDLHATLLHLLGIDHKELTYRYQGRRFRLTDVHGELVNDILA
ncbi:MAG TPA: sulfatase [Planctomycetaceae bacterium]|nr:sulfatase [Planctomycetaceae bacterium]